MSQWIGASILGLMAAVGLSWPAGAAVSRTRAEAAKLPLNELSLEVQALQTLRALNATRPQLEKLRKLAAATADQDTPRQPAKGGDKLRRALLDVHDALITAAEDDRLDKLLDQLEEVRQKEKAELDDYAELTDEAREEAPRLLRLLKPAQVAAYAGSYADEIPDPLERLLEGLKQVRGVKDEEWKQFRSELADDVGRALAGVDLDRATEIGDSVQQLLIVARGLGKAEYEKQRPELVKKARAIVGNAGPTDILRHFMENRLAELLSNPRLAQAAEALLKADQGIKKAAKK